MAANKTKPGRRNAARPPAKHFTLEQANRALPLVRRIAEDLVAEYAAVAALETEAQQIAAGPRNDPTQRPRIEALRADYNGRVEHLRELAEELTDVGCDLKDAQSGLLDFPSRHGDRTVCLCWRLGEPSVAHWHELDAGFAGRQPLDESFA